VASATPRIRRRLDLEKLWTALKTLYPVSISIAEVEEAAGGTEHHRRAVAGGLTSDAHHAYDARSSPW